MYAPGTILVLKKQKPPTVLEGKGEDGEDIEIDFPYNRVKVINQSPINHGGIASAEWIGANGQGVIITPLSAHGSTIDEPYGRLQELYDVESIPEQEFDAQPKIRVIESNSGSAGPTPEEQFAAAAEAAGQKKSETRVKTPLSPLDELS